MNGCRLNRRSQRALIVGASVAVLLAACGSSGSSGSSGGEGGDGPYFEGRDIEWLVAASQGGGSDTSSRMMAPFLQKHIEGDPSIQVFNEPAGNAIAGFNSFARSDPNGTNLTMSSMSSVMPYLLGMTGVEYSFTDFEAIIGIPLGGVVYANANSDIQNVTDLVKRDKILYGGEDVVGGDTGTLLSFELIGANVEPIMGYDGTGAIRIAMEQGEVEVTAVTSPVWQSEMKDQVDSGQVRPLYTFGLMKDGELQRDPLLPDVPHVGEVYETIHGKPPSGEVWDAYQVVNAARFDLSKAVWVHRAAPDAAKEALREAASAMVADQEFQAQKEVELGPYDILLGEPLEGAVANILDVDPVTLEWLRGWLVSEYDAEV